MAACNYFYFLAFLVLLYNPVHTEDNNNTISSEKCCEGIGYDIVHERLDSLQNSFLELFVHVKELGELVLNNQRTIEQNQLESNQLIQHHQKQITCRVEELESGVTANVSLISNYAKQILDLQTICANHESIKEELQKFNGNITYLNTYEKSTRQRSLLSRPLTNCQHNNNNLSTIESCKTVNSTFSGLFRMTMENYGDPITVFCELQRFGGGWLVIQQRFDGSVEFNRDWNEYKVGFGHVGQEFWLGLEAIHQITKQGTYELMVVMEDFKGNYSYARYSEFEVGSETEQYVLKKLGSYSGTAGDQLSYHKGMKFSTRDRDNDKNPSEHCARTWTGGWWYNSCQYSHLNGVHSNETDFKTIHWDRYNPVGKKFARMMIRKT